MAVSGRLDLLIQYRGSLSSCNYGCGYCPFAKARDSKASLRRDAEALERFVSWVESRSNGRFGILFTPWGEALIRRSYRDAMVRLSRLPQVWRVAAQTNLSRSPRWLAGADVATAGLWCTYHPSQTSRSGFLRRCRELDEVGVRYSVGMVGLREDLDEVEAVRGDLPDGVYLWVNAYKRVKDYYQADEIARILAVDPLFELNNRHHPSLGERCRAGRDAISVDAHGTVRRCHFVATPLGNLYDGSFETQLTSRVCPNQTCGCYIGYMNLERLRLEATFGDGMLERIPRSKGLAQNNLVD